MNHSEREVFLNYKPDTCLPYHLRHLEEEVEHTDKKIQFLLKKNLGQSTYHSDEEENCFDSDDSDNENEEEDELFVELFEESEEEEYHSGIEEEEDEESDDSDESSQRKRKQSKYDDGKDKKKVKPNEGRKILLKTLDMDYIVDKSVLQKSGFFEPIIRNGSNLKQEYQDGILCIDMRNVHKNVNNTISEGEFSELFEIIFGFLNGKELPDRLKFRTVLNLYNLADYLDLRNFKRELIDGKTYEEFKKLICHFVVKSKLLVTVFKNLLFAKDFKDFKYTPKKMIETICQSKEIPYLYKLLFLKRCIEATFGMDYTDIRNESDEHIIQFGDYFHMLDFHNETHVSHDQPGDCAIPQTFTKASIPSDISEYFTEVCEDFNISLEIIRRPTRPVKFVHKLPIYYFYKEHKHLEKKKVWEMWEQLTEKQRDEYKDLVKQKKQELEEIGKEYMLYNSLRSAHANLLAFVKSETVNLDDLNF